MIKSGQVSTKRQKKETIYKYVSSQSTNKKISIKHKDENNEKDELIVAII
jgi:hypothetical protein